MQVTEVIEQEHENPFGIHSIKEKLVNISSGVTLNDDIAGNILNVADAGKSRIIYFRQRQLISKDISFHAVIKKSNYKSFRYVVQKIRIAKIDGGVKVEEVNKNILGILRSYSLKTGKPVDFKGTALCSFCRTFKHFQPDGSRRYTAKSKLLSENKFLLVTANERHHLKKKKLI